MKNFKIIAVPEIIEDGKEDTPCSLQLWHWKTKYCTIWEDNKVTFDPSLDYLLEELEYFVAVGKMFGSFFNLKTQS